MAKRTQPKSEARAEDVNPVAEAPREDATPPEVPPAEPLPADPAPADPTLEINATADPMPVEASPPPPAAAEPDTQPTPDPSPEPAPETATDTPDARDVLHAPKPIIADAAAENWLPPPSQQPTPPSSRGGFVGTVLGGAIAAAAGYAVATFAPIPGLVPPSAPAYDAQAADAALTDRLAALEAAPAPDASLADRITALEARPEASPPPDLAPVSEALASLQDRLTALEQRPQVAADGSAPPADLLATVEALAAQVAALEASNSTAAAGIEALAAEAQARLAEAEAQAAALTAQAEDTARKARSSAAVGRILAALDSGTPFASVLPDLEGTEIPPALLAVAETGLPSRAALENAFVPAARQALEDSIQANMGSTWSDRMTSFLQSTTGARSLTPREGGHPDAVLSRAEAALRAGDVSQALTELEGLPPEGLAAMSDWSVMARQRLEAMTAAAALSAAVEG